MRIKEFWEEEGLEKKFSAPLPDGNFLSKLSPSDYLLDVGCGYGRLLNYLREKGFLKIFGVDYAIKLLRTVRDFPVAGGRAEELPFRDNTFNAVFLVGVLSSIIEDGSQKRVFEEIYRVLKPGGYLFVAAFGISNSDYYRKKYKEGLKEFGKYGVFRSSSGGVFRHISESRLRELLSRFKIEEFLSRPFITMHGRKATGFIVKGRKI